MYFLKYFFAFIIFTSAALACDEAGTVRHTNPDSSIGGLKGPLTKVNANAYIAYNAKVCGKAWVDAGAKVLDQAVVRGNVWIREYSTVKDFASVSDDAVLWGTRNAPVIASGRSKIYGRAKILTGTEVADESEVFGDVSVKDSKLSEKAKVCENYKITNQSLVDNYFCLSDADESRITIIPSNVSENKFNRLPRWIEFKSTDFNFSKDTNLYSVLLNGVQISTNVIEIRGKYLKIKNLSALIDGSNEIIISGRDEYEKKITQKVFNIVIGLNSKTITLLPAPTSPIKLNLAYDYRGETYSGDFKVEDGQIILQGLPSDTTDISLRLTGIGANGIIAESFANMESIGEELTISPFPIYRNNILNFSNGLLDWNISHPGNASIEGAGSQVHLVLSADESDRVVLAKTVRLASADKALSVNFSIPSFLMNRSIESNVEVILTNQDENEILYYEYSPAAFNKRKSTSGLLNLQIGKNVKGREFSVFYRILPSSQTKTIAQSLINVAPSNILKKYIKFEPKILVAFNIKSNKMKKTMLSNISCSDAHEYDLDPRARENFVLIYQEKMEYFSAGSFINMPLITSNKIFGNLGIVRDDNSKIITVELIGLQDGVEKIYQQIAPCMKEIITNNPSADFNSILSNNFTKYLFEVPLSQLSNVDTRAGAEITLKVKVAIREENGDINFYYSPDVNNLKILKSPDLNTSFNYSGNDRFAQSDPNYNLDGVDNWDSPTEGYARTGGDKWILPAYSDKLEGMMRLFATSSATPKWQINDLGSMNGGTFPDHTEHKNGRHADIQFKEYFFGNKEIIFDFKQLNNDKVKWKMVLDELDSLLSGVKDYYKYIEKIFIQRDNPWSKQFLNQRFENRCYNGRYIHMDTKTFSGSLLRDVRPHSNHLHVRFLEPKSNGEAGEINLDNSSLETLKLSDLIFHYYTPPTNKKTPDAEIAKIVIEPKDPVKFEGKKIFWRYQDKLGFDDIDMLVDLGEWPSPPSRLVPLEKINFSKSSSTRYLYIVFANENGRYGKSNGACVEKRVMVTPEAMSKFKKWTYKKVRNQYVMETI